MENTVAIVKAAVGQVEVLQSISKRTFSEAFGAANTQENMSTYLDERFSIERLTEELSSPDSTFYFAMLNNRIVGYLKVNFRQNQTDIKDEDALEIERIYVLREHQGEQVGQLLCNKAIEIASSEHLTYIWLGVWEENVRAIKFYEKNGFVKVDTHVFRLGDDEQTDFIMRLDLAT